ncbi:nitrate reductase molybdenum cofactor assembly chaperone [Amycolatopsis sp. NPDC059027]|uniref:nitrate reductase molybdenum cofactor assembly chaperone n=1 Tax=Amycolatopsis sp. NPDC059027 TaxID=3346709 RepID=UPI00366E28AA
MRLSVRKARGADQRTLAVLRQLCGWCLQYPDESVLGKLPLFRACLAELDPASPGHAELTRTIRYLSGGEPLSLAAHYVEVFERKPRRTLHLSWFTDGDTRRRGQTLAALKAFYRDHGFVPAENELPDFLPVLLEFAANAVPTAADGLLARFTPALRLLHRHLGTLDTPYRDTVAVVLATAPPPDERAAVALSETGPPAELVGLGPYPTGRKEFP